MDLAFRRRRRHRDGHARRRRRLEHLARERGVRLTFPPHDRALGAHPGEGRAQRRAIEARLQPSEVRRAPEVALVALRRGAVVPVHVNFKAVDLDEADGDDARAPRRPTTAVARLARVQHGVARVLVDAVELGVHERRRAAVERVAIREQHVERERARVAVGRELGAFASGGVVSDDKGVDEAQMKPPEPRSSEPAAADPRPDYRIEFGLDLVRRTIQSRVGRVAVRRPAAGGSASAFSPIASASFRGTHCFMRNAVPKRPG